MNRICCVFTDNLPYTLFNIHDDPSEMVESWMSTSVGCNKRRGWQWPLQTHQRLGIFLSTSRSTTLRLRDRWSWVLHEDRGEKPPPRGRLACSTMSPSSRHHAEGRGPDSPFQRLSKSELTIHHIQPLGELLIRGWNRVFGVPSTLTPSPATQPLLNTILGHCPRPAVLRPGPKSPAAIGSIALLAPRERPLLPSWSPEPRCASETFGKISVKVNCSVRGRSRAASLASERLKWHCLGRTWSDGRSLVGEPRFGSG